MSVPLRRPLPVERILLGDEAVGQAAVDAGITAAYGYPGTPATEILEYVQREGRRRGRPAATWCVNEKTAYEQALGASMVGRRALVVMKHVGLNVAADPFVNSAIVALGGGLVLAVADDPGMHSSQNEQDSRYYADFARIVCLEPADQQQAYDMTREAFELSERFRVPVMLRLVTRLAHTRTAVRLYAARPEPPVDDRYEASSWTLLPANARKLWRRLLAIQEEVRGWSEGSSWNRLEIQDDDRGLGVITTGVARGYYLENLPELDFAPSHLHIGAYPLPLELLRRLAARVRRILVLEEGQPYLERRLRGVLPTPVEIRGSASGHRPEDGELTPEIVRRALGLPERPRLAVGGPSRTLPDRPPQLCTGCPHRDSFTALNRVLAEYGSSIVASDIGCYTLGALPPYSAIDSCVSMGASVGMAKGAADAGLRPAVGIIGDSTFLHSGIAALIDAVAGNTDMTLLILDNDAVGMTGAQDTVLPSSGLESVVLGLGVPPEHCRVVEAHPRRLDDLSAALRQEIEHPGISVVIAVRECLEHARARKRRDKRG